MPFPLIPFLIVAGVILLVGGSIGIACLSGKTVAFIGMQGSGKTTAVQAFQAVSKEKKDWTANNNMDGTMVNTKEYDVLKFKACIDTSGAQQNKRGWENTISKADWVFYFFDISRLDNVMQNGQDKNRYYMLVKADLRDIASICKEKAKPVLVIATHTDLKYDKAKAKLHCDDILTELVHLKHDYVEGSLLDYDSAFVLKQRIEEKVKK